MTQIKVITEIIKDSAIIDKCRDKRGQWAAEAVEDVTHFLQQVTGLTLTENINTASQAVSGTKINAGTNLLGYNVDK